LVLYGPQYELSKSFLQVSLIRDLIEIIPYLSVLLALGRSRIYFYIHFIAAILIWGIDFVIVNLKLPAVFIALLFSVIQVAIAGSNFIYLSIRYKIKLVSYSMLKKILVISVHLSTTLLFLISIKNWISLGWNSFITIVVFGVLYYVLIIITGRLIRIDYGYLLLNRIKLFFG